MTGIFLFYFFFPFIAPYIYDRASYQPLMDILNLFSLDYLGWFSTGAWLYLCVSKNEYNPKVSCLISFAIVPLSLIVRFGINQPPIDSLLSCTALYFVFLATLWSRKFATFWDKKFFMFMGFISYPLYMIHENALVALTVKTHSFFPFIPDLLTPIPGIALIIFIAWVMAKFLEPALREQIKLWLNL